jgi:DNA mismatch endonuclease (patch repair protein)
MSVGLCGSSLEKGDWSSTKIFLRSDIDMDIMSQEQRSKLMSRIRGRNTTPELTVRSMLHRLGYRFRLHRKDLPGTPDIVFPSKRRVVFIDGCFWHGHQCHIGHLPSSNVRYWRDKIRKNQRRDAKTRNLLRAQGWQVLSVWECEVQNTNILTKRLIYFLGEKPLKDG